jgi:DNA-binding NarL/FixJ family response regulator
MNDQRKLLIVDQHPVLRQGIAVVLASRFERADVVEAETVEQAVMSSTGSTPDVVIVDPNIGGGDAMAVIAELRNAIAAPIVAFAEHGDMRVLSQALKAGARACVRKDSSPDVLVRAIGAVGSGEFFIDPALADGPADARAAGGLSLTERQREILQMYADGVHTERVAEALGLSPETIRTHTKRILAKLGANTRTQAVAIAVRHQLID